MMILAMIEGLKILNFSLSIVLAYFFWVRKSLSWAMPNEWVNMKRLKPNFAGRMGWIF